MRVRVPVGDRRLREEPGVTSERASADSSGGSPTDLSYGARRDPSLGTGGDAEGGSTTMLDSASRQYWRAVLDSGESTAIPRWTLHPLPGIGTHDVTVPGDLAASLHSVADELGLPLGSVVLAAHTKVLAALSGETSVSLGYVPRQGGPPLPCRVMTETGSWTMLLSSTHQVVTELETNSAYPIDDLRSELDLEDSVLEGVFDPCGRSLDLAEETVLAVDLAQDDDGLILKLRYRTDALDQCSAARIAGYHLTALAALATDPAAAHARQSLVSADELRFLIEGLAGPRRELPDLRFHELFEQRVRTHPDAVAAMCGAHTLTYRELNARANMLGRALLARGLTKEGIVAVVSERHLDWMAAVIAVFKAGGVYMPIEPHFPADRIKAMLTRSECALVLVERGSTATLEAALESMTGVQTLFMDDALREGHEDDDLGVEVTPNQLAYIYFTSGSTGEPKGAMCEQVGMLNHLYAKVDDLEISEGQVVAQVAPQCFDISLWQLVGALLVGGRTLIIEQDVILDVERFVDTIIDHKVAVAQVVPSYLEVVLSYLDHHPREMPHLRCVSVTGEALKKELAERWFAVMPAVKLVNAYGLTETSDDTNHEVMERPPEGDRVPLGRAINNVYLYVVDEDLAPVPLGAPGEIVFSGICVGRGYINDPDRTRMAYGPDPIRTGERLYRSGDYGRWRPDGRLEFLGRRDAQVKIRGFRIEIGDIESALLRVPGVRNGAVVVADRADGSKHLVAFYTGPESIEVNRVQQQLGEWLPAYMVPSAIQWMADFPLTANGKIDRKRLRPMAAELDTAEASVDPPTTPTERRLASAWASLLRIPEGQIGRRDSFFDLGGTSLSAVRLAVALDREVSLRDVTSLPVLADLAELVDGRIREQPHPRERQLELMPKTMDRVSDGMPAPAAQTSIAETTPIPVLPNVSRYLEERASPHPEHWNLGVLLIPSRPLDPEKTRQAIANLHARHDALRLRFHRDGSGWVSSLAPKADPPPFAFSDLSGVAEPLRKAALERRARELQESLDLERGPLIRVELFDLGDGAQRLLVVAHHFVMDPMSWPPFWEEFEALYEGAERGSSVQLPAIPTSFEDWARALKRRADSDELRAEMRVWLDLPWDRVRALPLDHPDGANTNASAEHVELVLTADETIKLFRRAPSVARKADVLLAALGRATAAWTDSDTALVDVMGYGRDENIAAGVDPLETVGFFVSYTPVVLQLPDSAPNAVTASLIERFEPLLRRGLEFDLLRYMSSDATVSQAFRELPRAQILFNHLGQRDEPDEVPLSQMLAAAPESIGPTHSPEGVRYYPIAILSWISDGKLYVNFVYSSNLHDRATVKAFSDEFIRQLRTAIADLVA